MSQFQKAVAPRVGLHKSCNYNGIDNSADPKTVTQSRRVAEELSSGSAMEPHDKPINSIADDGKTSGWQPIETARDFDPYLIWQGIDAEFVAGHIDGRDLSTPEPSSQRHPAYRHSWEVGRGEVEGWTIPAAWSRARVAHIEAGGEFYPYAKGTK